MKARFFLIVIMLAAASAFAQDATTPRMAVVKQKEKGVFKVIYQTARDEKMKMQIFDPQHELLFSDSRKISSFSRRINFDGMAHGEYTIEITDGQGKLSQSIFYGFEKSTVSQVKVMKLDDGKYLLAITNSSPEKIRINIFDGDARLLHSKELISDGKLKLVYNFIAVAGKPSFEITDSSGKVHIPQN